MNHAMKPAVPNYRATPDLGLASALRCVGVPFLRIEDGDERRVLFVFADDDRFEDCIRDFWSGRLQVGALDYFNAIRTLKSQIHAHRNNTAL